MAFDRAGGRVGGNNTTKWVTDGTTKGRVWTMQGNREADNMAKGGGRQRRWLTAAGGSGGGQWIMVSVGGMTGVILCSNLIVRL